MPDLQEGSPEQVNVYVVIDKPCCNFPMEVLGVYADFDEAWLVAEDRNGDSSRTHAYATIHKTILIGSTDD